eukprot:Nk52_evm7s2192 gene=Nk52_evmTU7s2192
MSVIMKLPTRAKVHSKRLSTVYNYLDADNDGRITLNDLKSYVERKTNLAKITPELVEEMFKEADCNGNNFLMKEDIEKILTYSFRHKKHRDTWITVLDSFFGQQELGGSQGSEKKINGLSAKNLTSQLFEYKLCSSPTNPKRKDSFQCTKEESGDIKHKNSQILTSNLETKEANKYTLLKIQRFEKRNDRDIKIRVVPGVHGVTVLDCPHPDDIRQKLRSSSKWTESQILENELNVIMRGKDPEKVKNDNEELVRKHPLLMLLNTKRYQKKRKSRSSMAYERARIDNALDEEEDDNVIINFDTKRKFQDILSKGVEREEFFLATEAKKLSLKGDSNENMGPATALLSPAIDMSPKNFVDSSAVQQSSFILRPKVPPAPHEMSITVNIDGQSESGMHHTKPRPLFRGKEVDTKFLKADLGLEKVTYTVDHNEELNKSQSQTSESGYSSRLGHSKSSLNRLHSSKSKASSHRTYEKVFTPSASQMLKFGCLVNIDPISFKNYKSKVKEKPKYNNLTKDMNYENERLNNEAAISAIDVKEEYRKPERYPPLGEPGLKKLKPVDTTAPLSADRNYFQKRQCLKQRTREDEKAILEAFRFRDIASKMSPLEGIDTSNIIKRDEYIPKDKSNFNLHFSNAPCVHKHTKLMGGKSFPFVTNEPPKMSSSRKAFLARAENKLFRSTA